MAANTDKYATPTNEDIQAAKRYILMREEYAVILGERIDDLLLIAADEIVSICYKYNVDPKRLVFSSSFNASMMEEIADAMDELEEAIYDLILEYSTRATNDTDRIKAVLPWLEDLGRGDNNLRDTLHGYLHKTMKDWEAAIAAMLFMGLLQGKAIERIIAYLHNIYGMPEVLTAMRRKFEFSATYIRLGGVQPGAVGISNNGSTNVVNMGKTTLQMTWMRIQGMEFKDNGAIGYWQGRGSTFNCDICDDEVGFHDDINDIYDKPYPHPHCQCWRAPVYSKEQMEQLENT